MDTKAINKLSYGLYLLTVNDGKKDNGCIINTAMQLAGEPLRIGVSLNNDVYTCEMLKASGVFNICVLHEGTPFSFFDLFGMKSGRDTDKFAQYTDYERSANGLIYVKKYANAYISGRVLTQTDLGSHTLFIAELTDAERFGEGESMTYSYYHANVKPKPQPTAKAANGLRRWECEICGYVYEGESLPEDFECPLCKHKAQFFKEISPAEVKTGEGNATGLRRWECEICGYVYEGENLPDDFECPLCKHKVQFFKEITPVETKAGEDNAATASKRWECEICGYIYEGESLPDDFECPICKHKAQFFREI